LYFVISLLNPLFIIKLNLPVMFLFQNFARITCPPFKMAGVKNRKFFNWLLLFYLYCTNWAYFNFKITLRSSQKQNWTGSLMVHCQICVPLTCPSSKMIHFQNCIWQPAFQPRWPQLLKIEITVNVRNMLFSIWNVASIFSNTIFLKFVTFQCIL